MKKTHDNTRWCTQTDDSSSCLFTHSTEMTLCRFSSFVPISFVPSTHAAPAEITEVDKPSNNALTTDACRWGVCV